MYLDETEATEPPAGDASPDEGHSLPVCSEPPELVDSISLYIVSLSYGGRSELVYLLGTLRGVVHWYECEDAIRRGQFRDLKAVPKGSLEVHDTYTTGDHNSDGTSAV
ncbi:hypothetical protein PG988_001351 [Apiospora saccharicola]